MPVASQGKCGGTTSGIFAILEGFDQYRDRIHSLWLNACKKIKHHVVAQSSTECTYGLKGLRQEYAPCLAEFRQCFEGGETKSQIFGQNPLSEQFDHLVPMLAYVVR